MRLMTRDVYVEVCHEKFFFTVQKIQIQFRSVFVSKFQWWGRFFSNLCILTARLENIALFLKFS